MSVVLVTSAANLEQLHKATLFLDSLADPFAKQADHESRQVEGIDCRLFEEIINADEQTNEERDQLFASFQNKIIVCLWVWLYPDQSDPAKSAADFEQHLRGAKDWLDTFTQDNQRHNRQGANQLRYCPVVVTNYFVNSAPESIKEGLEKLLYFTAEGPQQEHLVLGYLMTGRLRSSGGEAYHARYIWPYAVSGLITLKHFSDYDAADARARARPGWRMWKSCVWIPDVEDQVVSEQCQALRELVNQQITAAAKKPCGELRQLTQQNIEDEAVRQYHARRNTETTQREPNEHGNATVQPPLSELIHIRERAWNDLFGKIWAKIHQHPECVRSDDVDLSSINSQLQNKLATISDDKVAQISKELTDSGQAERVFRKKKLLEMAKAKRLEEARLPWYAYCIVATSVFLALSWFGLVSLQHLADFLNNSVSERLSQIAPFLVACVVGIATALLLSEKVFMEEISAVEAKIKDHADKIDKTHEKIVTDWKKYNAKRLDYRKRIELAARTVSAHGLLERLRNALDYRTPLGDTNHQQTGPYLLVAEQGKTPQFGPTQVRNFIDKTTFKITNNDQQTFNGDGDGDSTTSAERIKKVYLQKWQALCAYDNNQTGLIKAREAIQLETFLGQKIYDTTWQQSIRLVSGQTSFNYPADAAENNREFFSIFFVHPVGGGHPVNSVSYLTTHSGLFNDKNRFPSVNLIEDQNNRLSFVGLSVYEQPISFQLDHNNPGHYILSA